jgi:MoxR-like ATPase
VDETELFGREFLIRRPVLEAIESEQRVLLLIDEIDRADEEFEAFLLEVLSDFQVTVPELGTIEAKQRPYVILTSNRTRELHDALKRRCLYHWIDHPTVAREIQIVELRVPGVPERLAEEAARFAAELRSLDLQKPPGLAETIDWVRALTALGQRELDVENVQATLGSLLKYHDDLLSIRDEALAGLVVTARG